MKKIFCKIMMLAGLFATAMTFSAFCGADVMAAEKNYIEYSVKKNVTYEKTIEFDFGTTIHYSVTYPYFRTADKALTKKVNAAVKEAVVKGPVADYKNSKYVREHFGEDRGLIEITAEYLEISRAGNIVSIPVEIVFAAHDSAFPAVDERVININFAKGKQSTFKGLFSSSKKTAKFFAKTMLDNLSMSLLSESAVFENIGAEDIAKVIDAESLIFDWDGVHVIIDELDGLTPHAMGVTSVFVPFEEYEKYLKKSQKEIVTLSSGNIYYERNQFSAGTGYGWVYEISDPETLEMLCTESYPMYKGILEGGRMMNLAVFRGLKEGNVTVTAKLVRPWMPDSPAETVISELCVNSDLTITCLSGENN